jgi:hypothetical protein
VEQYEREMRKNKNGEDGRSGKRKRKRKKQKLRVQFPHKSNKMQAKTHMRENIDILEEREKHFRRRGAGSSQTDI